MVTTNHTVRYVGSELLPIFLPIPFCIDLPNSHPIGTLPNSDIVGPMGVWKKAKNLSIARLLACVV